MTLRFDTDAEDSKIQAAHEKEEEDIAQILSEKYGYEYTDLSVVAVKVSALRLVLEEKARASESVVFDKVAKKISIAIHNPHNQLLPALLADLEEKGYIITKFLVSRKSLEKAYKRYADLSFTSESKVGIFDISNEELSEISSKIKSVSSIRSFIKSTVEQKQVGKVSRLLEYILAGAFSSRASDIHFEPEGDTIRLRFRIDGILTDMSNFNIELYRLVDSRIKILSGLKLNVHDRAQDGRFSVVLEGTEIEIRVSLIPNAYGESYVLRILNPKSTQTSFSDLGIPNKLLERLIKEIKKPNGMLLTTGPTGSGKTTTLYAFLRKIRSSEIKIITIEDPVEYHLKNVVQTQVDGDKYTFASGLRSIVRQDPDVIMVGEIRDNETASIAMQAALTGHFVLSTLHTNNAAGTFPRFADLGIDPKEFASAITVSMAQRLVRKLKETNKKQVPIPNEQKQIVEKILSTVQDTSLLPDSIDTMWVPDIISDDDTGYYGRVGLYEAIFMDDELGEFLRDNPSESDIAKKAQKQGYLTMAQDGVIKALAGETTLDEVFRTVDTPNV